MSGRKVAVSVRTEPVSGAPVREPREEEVLYLGDIFRVLWKRLWVIVAMVVVLTGAVIGFSLAQTPVYDASIKLLVGQKGGGQAAPGSLGGEVQGLQQLAQTMAGLVDTRPVAEAVIQDLGLRMSPQELIGNLSVQQVSSTQTIEVTYEDTDPQRARNIANTVGEAFSNQVSKLSTSANSVTATVWERAVTPDSPSSPNLLLNGLLAVVLGLVLGVGLAFLLEYLDDSLQSPEDLELVSGVPTFGVLPDFSSSKGQKDKKRKSK